jgi:hypothetical protein
VFEFLQKGIEQSKEPLRNEPVIIDMEKEEKNNSNNKIVTGVN